MGKRNKKKLRKVMRSQMGAQSVETAATPSTDGHEPVSEPTKEVKPQEVKKPEDIAETHETKKEIRKILITYSILILAIVAIYLINTKTDIILKAGEFIVSKLNLIV